MIEGMSCISIYVSFSETLKYLYPKMYFSFFLQQWYAISTAFSLGLFTLVSFYFALFFSVPDNPTNVRQGRVTESTAVIEWDPTKGIERI